MARRRLLFVVLGVVILAAVVAGGWYLFCLALSDSPCWPVDPRGPAAGPPPMLAPPADRSIARMRCQDDAKQLRRMAHRWVGIWTPFARESRKEQPTAGEWRDAASAFAVLQTRLTALELVPPLRQPHLLLVRAAQDAREGYELAAVLEETDSSDQEAASEARNSADRARELYIGADRILDGRPCTRVGKLTSPGLPLRVGR
jgi:hypothetical protein